MTTDWIRPSGEVTNATLRQNFIRRYFGDILQRGADSADPKHLSPGAAATSEKYICAVAVPERSGMCKMDGETLCDRIAPTVLAQPKVSRREGHRLC